MSIRLPSASNRTVRVTGPGMPEILGRPDPVFRPDGLASSKSDHSGV